MINMKSLQAICAAATLSLVGCNSMVGSNSEDTVNSIYTADIGGVDINRNGVRDDIELYIFKEYQRQPDYIPELMAVSKTIRNITIDNSDTKKYGENLLVDITKHMACLNLIGSTDSKDGKNLNLIEDLVERHSDTPERRAKIEKAMERAKKSKTDNVIKAITKDGALTKDCKPYAN